MELLLSGYGRTHFDEHELSDDPVEQQADVESVDIPTPSHATVAQSAASGGAGHSMKEDYSPRFPLEDHSVKAPKSTIAEAVDLYFELCHRQPIWCFERQELEPTLEETPELLYSILELTARFSRDPDPSRCYGENARWSIMLKVANGTVQLETIESLCLLSYSSFIGNGPYSLLCAVNQSEINLE